MGETYDTVNVGKEEKKSTGDDSSIVRSVGTSPKKNSSQ